MRARKKPAENPRALELMAADDEGASARPKVALDEALVAKAKAFARLPFAGECTCAGRLAEAPGSASGRGTWSAMGVEVRR